MGRAQNQLDWVWLRGGLVQKSDRPPAYRQGGFEPENCRHRGRGRRRRLPLGTSPRASSCGVVWHVAATGGHTRRGRRVSP
eukprot:2054420-Rhodomonas_salina.2